MEDIKIKLLGEICEFYSGTGFPKKFQGNLEGKYPFYKVGDISKSADENKNFLTKSDNYVDERIVKTLKGKIVPPKTIVFAKIGEALKLNRRMITSTECLIDNNVLGIKPKNDSILAEYIFYFMKFVKLENYSESTTVPSVRKSELEKIKIRVPSIQNQQKIISILENIDKTKKSKTESLKKLNELIKARFVEMFGDPQDSKSKWKKSTIEKCCTLKSGKTLPRNIENEGGNIPYFKVKDMNSLENTTYITTSTRFVSDKTANKSIFPVGTVIFPKRGGAIGTNKKRLTKVPICADLNIMGVIPDNTRISSYYLFEYFNMVDLNTLNNGSSVPQINNKDINPLNINIPPLSLQNEFANFVHQVDKSKFENIVYLNKTLSSKILSQLGDAIRD